MRCGTPLKSEDPQFALVGLVGIEPTTQGL
jgi:hypothetical protein